MPLHVSNTMCSSSGGQNCIIQHLVSSHSVGGHPVHRTARDGHLQCDDTRCCIIQFWPPDDEHNGARNMYTYWDARSAIHHTANITLHRVRNCSSCVNCLVFLIIKNVSKVVTHNIHKRQASIHVTGGIRTSNDSKRGTADPFLRPLGLTQILYLE